MGIESIRLGKRSRILEAQEQEQRQLDDTALAEPAGDQVAHPPLPGPANPGAPMSLRGCGCGKFHIPVGLEELEVESVLHRHSKPCFFRDAHGGRVYYDHKAPGSLEHRVDVLERLVAELLAGRPA